jgi:phosphate transport system permease protein
MLNTFARMFKGKTDAVFKFITVISAFIVIALMAGFFFQLLWHSLPSIQKFGIPFLYSDQWDPVRNEYGAASAIYGTLVTTVIAMVIAVPLSFVIAMFLVELAHPLISKVMGQAIDLLAAIPSIIFGMWGLFIFVPFMQNYIQPFLADVLHLKSIPFIGELFRGPKMGFGMITAGVVLALMILPFISAVMRDVFRMVPHVVKESAYGCGATTWEVTVDVTMKYGLQGLIGAVFLGLGRAIGETMAVLFIIGNCPKVSASLFAPGTTISATLANNFAEAGGIFKNVLFELGLILLVITFLIQVAAQYWLNRVKKSAGGGL